MIKKSILAIALLATFGFTYIRLSSNKAKINKESAYKETVENIPVNVLNAHESIQNIEQNFVGLFDASKEATISAEVSGRITRVLAKEGDYVAEGQIVAEFDKTTLSLKLEADQVQYAHSKEDLARYENLFAKEATTDIALKQARLNNSLNEIAVKSTKDQISKSNIKAPISGYLISRNFEKGMIINPGTVIGEIANTALLKFNTMVPENEVVKLHLHQNVTINADVFPNSKFVGAISRIAEKGDQSHNYKVEVLINNAKRQFPLKAGMNGTMAVGESKSTSIIFVPREAVVGTTKQPQIFVANGNKATLQNIKLGSNHGNTVQVVSGINDGTKVIVTGMNILKNGTTIKINNETI